MQKVSLKEDGFRKVAKAIDNIVDLRFILKFVIIFVPLYYLHIAFRGITDPNDFYLPFLDAYLNYIKWFEASILHTSDFILHLFGYNSFVEGQRIEVFNGAFVRFWPSCAGLGIISFWIAFVVAHDINFKLKFYWAFMGIIIIWFINSWRIAILLMSLEDQWKTPQYIDHHDLYTIIAYGFIFLLMLLFIKTAKTHPLLKA